ncbi:unnamed protein product, partial [Nesidiocoris tenuis]
MDTNPPPTDSKEIATRQIGTGSSIVHLLYNFSKQAGKLAIVYLFGYFNISPAWLLAPVVLSVLREEWGKEKELKRNIAKAAALSNEKEVILARVDDLPAWILNQVWPNVNHYAKDLIKDVIEPAVQESLLQYKLSGFSFQKMRLGTIIHGMIRVVMKPLIRTIPLVGGLQIYFLNNPNIDFNLVGVADLLDMPGLSSRFMRTPANLWSADCSTTMIPKRIRNWD